MFPLEKQRNMESEDFLKKTPTTSVSSPCFNYTPKRIFAQKSAGTPLNAIEENVDENKDRKTPASTNPFDIKSEAFSFPVCSPSIFATFSRNSTDKQRPFRWSIEHLSVLFPADIDETSIPDSWTDPDQELKAQKAIDAFFSQNSIVPSPWSPTSSSGGGRKIKMRRTIRRSSPTNSFSSNDDAIPKKTSAHDVSGAHKRKNPVGCSEMTKVVTDSCDWTTQVKQNGVIIGKKAVRCTTVVTKTTSRFQASTQTKLTIPPTVNLQALLGEYFTYQEENDSNCCSVENSPKESELMNTSSLRRKLFVAKEENSTPKWCTNSSSSDLPWCTPNLQMHSVNTPASDVLSSSPISQRNCSDCCNVLPVGCLDFSPIAAPKDRSSISKSGLRTRSFSQRIDEESNSSSDKSSFHSASPPPESMSFTTTQSQESLPFPSYSSKEQDTGYATGSSQSAMTSIGMGGTLSRVTPVTELLEDCCFSRSDMSIDGVGVCPEPTKQIDAVSSNLDSWPWFPGKCSTPTKTYNF